MHTALLARTQKSGVRFPAKNRHRIAGHSASPRVQSFRVSFKVAREDGGEQLCKVRSYKVLVSPVPSASHSFRILLKDWLLSFLGFGLLPFLLNHQFIDGSSPS